MCVNDLKTRLQSGPFGSRVASLEARAALRRQIERDISDLPQARSTSPLAHNASQRLLHSPRSDVYHHLPPVPGRGLGVIAPGFRRAVDDECWLHRKTAVGSVNVLVALLLLQ